MRHILFRRLPFLFLLLACALLPAYRGPGLIVSYKVDATDPSHEAIKIEMFISNNTEPTLTVAIPAWMPGAYRNHEFSKDIKDVAAADASGQALKVTALDHQTWLVETQSQNRIKITYRRTMNKDNFNDEHCFLQGPATYLYVKDHLDVPHRVLFAIPKEWKIATALGDGYEAIIQEATTYTARDYDTFVDCPTELGKFTLKTFQYKKAQYEVVIHGGTDLDMDRFMGTIQKVVANQVDFFDDTPYSRYVFFYHIDQPSYGGGLEHLNSTSIALTGAPFKEGNYDYFAEITAHEFFHLWNVKRIRPNVLGPFDYSKEARTNALWFCEGVTDYYAHLSLARAGVWSEERLLQGLAKEISTLQNNSDRLVTSMERASWTVWEDHEGPSVSYYTKGLLLGMLMDLRIRALTDNRRSLDDVMLFLHRWFVKEGDGPIGEGFEERDLKRAVHAVSGHDFGEFFQKYVGGTVELPLEELLKEAGLELKMTKVTVPWLGVYRTGSYIYGTDKDSAAAKAGLKYGFRIVAINGKDVDRTKIDETLKPFKEGDVVTIKANRGEESLEAKIPITMKEMLEYSITPADKPTEKQQRIRQSWLTGK